jgi:hypothetical protein
VNSIKKNEVCLKSAIWSPKIQDNKELKKKPDRLKDVKQILCEDNKFWSAIGLVEELLRPLKTSILAIEGSTADVRKSYKIVQSAFHEALEVADKFVEEQVGENKQVISQSFFNKNSYFRFSTTVSTFARAI